MTEPTIDLALPPIHMPDDAGGPAEQAPVLPPLPEGRSGDFGILHRVLPAGRKLKFFDGEVSWPVDRVFDILHQHGSTWMSSTPQETVAMAAAADHAVGDVLVTGLGLGVFHRCLRPAVRSCLTLEMNPDVVRLVWRHLAAADPRLRLRLISAEDGLRRLADEGRRFDFVYLDTWDSGDYEQLPAVNWYVRTAQSMLRPGGAVWAWTYESMIRHYVRECQGLAHRLVRHKDRIVHAEKRAGLRAMWPMIGRFADWLFDERNGMASVDEIDAWCQDLGRRITAAPEYLFQLTERRMADHLPDEMARLAAPARPTDPMLCRLTRRKETP